MKRRIKHKFHPKPNLNGLGLYIYEYNTRGEVELPKPANEGFKTLGIKQRFTGDDYFMFLVKSHDLKVIKDISKEVKMEQKLILDQPDIVTTKGIVEHIIEKPIENLNESPKEEIEKDVLICEVPISGVVVID